MKFHILTFGCQQNIADSERIAASFIKKGIKPTNNINLANYVILNTCMIRESAENRVYGIVENLKKRKQQEKNLTIIVTGCMSGLAYKDKSGKYMKRLRKILPSVNEFVPIEEFGFEYQPIRSNDQTALIPISNGCNNFCSYCIVPYTRGREISRPYEDIISDAKNAIKNGYSRVMLIGQNVNSYGSDFFDSKNSKLNANLSSLVSHYKPVLIKHLGKYRIPTFFPHLLQDIVKTGFKHIEFMSSNPWDFSDELIQVIAKNPPISRTIHLPLQSGDDNVLKRMNRWYSAKEYYQLIEKLRAFVPNVKITTDIIVGFCGETDDEFENTVSLCKKIHFEKAYVSIYSKRPYTYATNHMQDDIPYQTKKKRWEILEDLIYRSKHSLSSIK